MNPTTLAGYQTILMKEQTSGCGYWLQTADSRISSGFNDGGCIEHLSSGPPIPLGQWSHLAAVFNNATDTYTLYLNGTAIASSSETDAPVPNTQALVLRAVELQRLRVRALARADRRRPRVRPTTHARPDPGGHEHGRLGRHFFGTCARPRRR